MRQRLRTRHSPLPAGLILACLLLAAPSLSAGGPPETAARVELKPVDDEILAGLKVVQVTPLVVPDHESRVVLATLVQRGARSKKGDTAKGAGGALVAAIGEAQMDEGMGFAGASTEADLLMLRYGQLLGMAPRLGQQGEDLRGDLRRLAPQIGALDGILDEKVSRALAAYRAGLMAAEPSAWDYVTLLHTANQAMIAAEEPAAERLHGYLLLGLWTGMARMLAAAELPQEQSIQMGRILIEALEKDAELGGSDRDLAQHARAITTALQRPRADLAAIDAAILAMSGVSHDR